MAEKPPAIEPLSLAEIMAEGLDHRREGRAGQAEAAFQMVIDAAPRHAEALHQLGLLALDGGRPRIAAGLLRRAVDIAPDRDAPRFSLGRALITPGHHGDAVETLRRARALKPEFAPIHFQLGRALRGLGRLDHAGAALRRALELDPRRLAAHLELGNAFGAQGKAERAAHNNDSNRSIALDRLRPLFEVPKTQFFSLQVGDRAADPSNLGIHRQIEDLSADLDDFAETAAALAVLDLLIFVDTAPAATRRRFSSTPNGALT